VEIIKFDTTKTKMRDIVKSHFNNKELSLLHEEDSSHSLFSKQQDQSSLIHKKFYKIYEQTDFLIEYDNFIKDFIRNRYQESIVYQKRPTFRIHMPGNVAVGEFHKDKHYQHSIWETNYWLPFTDAFSTNTIWIESEEDKGDFSPIELGWGELLIFDGSNLNHGNKPNTTGVSRVSIDFRIMPYSKYDENNNNKSTHLALPMKIGGYYSFCD
jgi:ectoine hydroxylase-related dioxygenase (phytanoyl-CoA dioxygenase family)